MSKKVVIIYDKRGQEINLKRPIGFGKPKEK